MRYDQQLVLYRDNPARLAGLYRIQAETSLRQFPENLTRYQHYMTEADRIEREGQGEMRDEQRNAGA